MINEKKLKRKFCVMLASLLLFSGMGIAGGFLKVSSTVIVDGEGNEIILRGMGLGGWMVPEGYMLKTEGFANASWEIKSKITELIGQQNADSFWTVYRKNFVQRKDIKRLAEIGFNSVRLAMHWEFYMNGNGTMRSDAFILTDSLLAWCAENKIYLILDLHAAPGGQSANNISDYNSAYPSLWQSETNKLHTIDLWRSLADHYKNEPWIGGYDIINEPAWDLPPNNQPLRDLSVAITNAIRSVDTMHIVFVEGNWFATDFNGMAPAWDNNMVWSFHKYWNSNDLGAINYLLTLRNSTNRPLWLGESGENSNTWFTDCINLMESNKIGWSWWTLKKFSTINGPFSVPISPEYNNLLRYWNGQTSKPTVAYATNALLKMAEGLELEKCIYNEGVIDAMMRQPYDNSTRPFSLTTIPGKIYLVNYNFGKNGIAYKDVVFANTGNNAAWNNGWVYRNDGVDIETCSDAITNGYNVGWIESGEFLTYTVNVQQSGMYNVVLRNAANDAGGYVGMSWAGKDQVIVPIAKTGGWQTWGNTTMGTVGLSAGVHQLKLNMFFSGFNLNYLDCIYAGPMAMTERENLPSKFLLQQNYPNPFNPSTTIKYRLADDADVILIVHDILGKKVAELVNERQSAGHHSVIFRAEGVPNGIYFYSIRAGSFTETKKLLLLK